MEGAMYGETCVDGEGPRSSETEHQYIVYSRPSSMSIRAFTLHSSTVALDSPDLNCGRCCECSPACVRARGLEAPAVPYAPASDSGAEVDESTDRFFTSRTTCFDNSRISFS